MRCCVPFCNATAESAGVTFHEFPSEDHLRAAWLRALGKQDSLSEPAVVCSQHFLNDDFCATQSGSRQIRTGAIPTTVQVCMICLDTRSKLLPMSKYKLDEVYRQLVGRPLCDQRNLRQTLCVQCAQRLVNFNKFRDKSLRAQCLMMEVVDQHEIITIKHIKSINRVTHQLESDIVKTVLEPNHCDMYIQSDADTQTELDTIAVKCEESHDSMSVDAEHTQHMPVREDDNNADCFNRHSIAYKEEYLSDGSHPTEIKDPLLTTSSISKEQEAETVAPIKQEITLACPTCLMGFTDEDVYMKHTLMHMEDMVSPDDHSVAHSSHTSVAPLPVGLTKNHQNEVHPTDTNSELTVEVFHNNEAIVQDLRQSQITITQPDPLAQSNNSVNLYTTRRDESLNNKPSDTDYGETENKTSPDSIFGTALGNGSKQKQYICDVCLKMFKKKDLLIKHLESLTCVKTSVKTSLTCQFCKYQSRSNSTLIEHMRTHTGEKPFACELCDYKASRKFHLLRHMRTHTGEKPLACQKCDYKCTYKYSLVTHMRSHTGEKPFDCHLCSYTCARKSHLVEHIKTHTDQKDFACQYCDFKCVRKSNLAQHLRKHIGEKRFVCMLCKCKCFTNSELLLHMRTHTGEKPFACDICGHKSARKTHLVKHIRTHTREKPYACELCDGRYSDRSTLVTHMRTHTGEKPYACEMCDYKFITKSMLDRHVRTHTGVKPFVCKLCNNKYSKNSSLVHHMRTHTGEKPPGQKPTGKKPYACELCDYKSAQKAHLMNHIRTHTGEKPYACEFCDYRSAQKYTLVKHIRTHTGEKPFACKLCDSKYSVRSSLVTHMRTHTGEKPYACELCDYRATHKSTLVKHVIRIHTGEKPS